MNAMNKIHVCYDMQGEVTKLARQNLVLLLMVLVVYLVIRTRCGQGLGGWLI
jgi:hypothetical protein